MKIIDLLSALKTKLKLQLYCLKYEKRLRNSPLFDQDYYLTNNPDVACDGITPERHYLLFGAKEGRNPSSKFDTKYYWSRYPDVGASNMNPLVHYLLYGKQQHRRCLPPERLFHNLQKFDRMDIVTTKHCQFIAELYKKYLNELSISCAIYEGEPEAWQDIPYIIICPQFVSTFPEVYIAVQMEQTVSSRWLTEDYLDCLENACAVFDYSTENISYFKKQKSIGFAKRIYYLPVDYYPGFRKLENIRKEYDVIFYGDKNSCERRSLILEKLSRKFKVKICSEVFGEELYEQISKAKVLVNIHYYGNSLLETTRLYETLSLNSCVIVSEVGRGEQEMDRLKQVVDFVSVDEYEELERHISFWVENKTAREEKLRRNHEILESRPNAVPFFLYRFLLAYGRISFDEFYCRCSNYLQLRADNLCLSLPETGERRKEFDSENKYGFQVVDGLRHETGWIGCALSYKFIFKKALESGLDYIVICEDDVKFKKDFVRRFTAILKLLEQKSWDVFSGLISDFDERQIVKDVITIDDINFGKISHVVSTVFNVYNRSVFPLLANWDEENGNVNINTIDRYLENENLEVWTTAPFLVAHKPDLNSTIWPHGNEAYVQMIKNSEFKLEKMINEKKLVIKIEKFLDQNDALSQRKP